MKRNEWLILLVFCGLMVPSYFFLNNYVVVFISLLTLSLIVYLSKEDILAVRFDELLRSKKMYAWAFEALKYAIFAQAAVTLIFRPEPNAVDDLVQRYPIMPVLAVISAPIIEETVFRKVIFGALARRFNFWTSSVISSLLFAIGHDSLERFIGYFLTGMVFCRVYHKSGSLYPVLLAHMALNLISVAVMTLRG